MDTVRLSLLILTAVLVIGCVAVFLGAVLFLLVKLCKKRMKVSSKERDDLDPKAYYGKTANCTESSNMRSR